MEQVEEIDVRWVRIVDGEADGQLRQWCSGGKIFWRIMGTATRLRY